MSTSTGVHTSTTLGVIINEMLGATYITANTNLFVDCNENRNILLLLTPARTTARTPTTQQEKTAKKQKHRQKPPKPTTSTSGHNGLLARVPMDNGRSCHFIVNHFTMVMNPWVQMKMEVHP